MVQARRWSAVIGSLTAALALILVAVSVGWAQHSFASSLT